MEILMFGLYTVGVYAFLGIVFSAFYCRQPGKKIRIMKMLGLISVISDVAAFLVAFLINYEEMDVFGLNLVFAVCLGVMLIFAFKNKPEEDETKKVTFRAGEYEVRRDYNPWNIPVKGMGPGMHSFIQFENGVIHIPGEVPDTRYDFTCVIRKESDNAWECIWRAQNNRPLWKRIWRDIHTGFLITIVAMAPIIFELMVFKNMVFEDAIGYVVIVICGFGQRIFRNGGFFSKLMWLSAISLEGICILYFVIKLLGI